MSLVFSIPLKTLETQILFDVFRGYWIKTNDIKWAINTVKLRCLFQFMSAHNIPDFIVTSIFHIGYCLHLTMHIFLFIHL